MKTHSTILLVLLAFIAAGCAGPAIPDPDPEGGGTMVDDSSSADTDPFGDDSMGDGEFIDADHGNTTSDSASAALSPFGACC